MDRHEQDVLPLVAPNGAQQPPNPAATAAAAAAAQGVNRRYRPAPAKTFQCRGYGDCRMVFSRSEHLARHIRKHTGERPFTCHCGKQFSRLDNLRQHAQTVHADKQDANERMMRDLSSLHATMAAANKATQHRGKRGAQLPPPVAVSLSADSISDSSAGGGPPANQHHHHQQNGSQGGGVKQEDIQSGLPLVSQRPGTSTGYEGDTDILYHHQQHQQHSSRSWYVPPGQEVDRPHSRQVSSHSFRDPGQSFRAPSSASPTSPASATAPSAAASISSSSPSSAHHNYPGQSFLASRESLVDFGVSDLPSPWSTTARATSAADRRPGSSSRPSTASREPPDAYPRTLPPLSAVVSSSLPPSQWGTVPPQSFFSLPSGPGIIPPRPTTATRPGTAPAAYYPSHPSFGGNGGSAGMVLSTTSAAATSGNGGYGGELGGNRSSGYYGSSADASTDSSIGGGYDSPFSFHPPALTEQPAYSRKRPYSGIDDDDRDRLGSSAGGSESRPQSRRLSVMELCNDTDADPTARPFLPLSANQGGSSIANGGSSRPGTASTSFAALALADAPTPREQQQQSSLRSGAPPSAGSSAAQFTSPGSSPSPRTSPRGGSSSAGTSPRAGPSGGGRVQHAHQQQRTPVFGSIVPSTVLRHGAASPPLRAGPGGPGGAYTSPGSSPGAGAPRGYGPPEPRRDRADQVRLAVSSPHAASALGMRV
ncbi:hypothetical protein BC834DRAFT_428757 [Gloeopeniophorella convolvens]|nr:hypothetical protein BC834DRAFT_428757 [Gloeopeniophorella convolvens]